MLFLVFSNLIQSSACGVLSLCSKIKCHKNILYLKRCVASKNGFLWFGSSCQTASKPATSPPCHRRDLLRPLRLVPFDKTCAPTDADAPHYTEWAGLVQNYAKTATISCPLSCTEAPLRAALFPLKAGSVMAPRLLNGRRQKER